MSMTAGSSSYSILARRAARRACSRVSAMTAEDRLAVELHLAFAPAPARHACRSARCRSRRARRRRSARRPRRARRAPPTGRRSSACRARPSTGRGRHAACRPAPACRRYRRPCRLTCLCAESWRWSVATPPMIFAALRFGCWRACSSCRLVPRNLDRRLGAAGFGEEAQQQVAAPPAPGIRPMARMSVSGVKSSAYAASAASTVASVHGLPSSALLDRVRPLRRRRHAAIGDADVGDRAVLGQRQDGRRRARR